MPRTTSELQISYLYNSSLSTTNMHYYLFIFVNPQTCIINTDFSNKCYAIILELAHIIRRVWLLYFSFLEAEHFCLDKQLNFVIFSCNSILIDLNI